MGHSWKKRVGLLAAGAAASVAAARTVAGYFMSMAVDRSAPPLLPGAGLLTGSKKKTQDDYAWLEEAKEALRQRENETVELTARDGVKLLGHWMPHPEAERVILAVHGWRSSWYSDFCGVAPFWRENRCSVLFIEQRGQNGSEGEYISFGLVERYDCLEWLEWIRQRCGEELPVYLAGISMGASTVLMTADLELPGNVRGIMADCGFTSPEAIWRHVTRKNLHLPYVLTGYFSRRLCEKKLGLRADEGSTVESLRRARVPVLLIHGEEDHFVPVEMTYENYAACASPKRMLIVPGAGHGMSYVVDREAYEGIVQKFWAEYDH